MFYLVHFWSVLNEYWEVPDDDAKLDSFDRAIAQRFSTAPLQIT